MRNDIRINELCVIGGQKYRCLPIYAEDLNSNASLCYQCELSGASHCVNGNDYLCVVEEKGKRIDCIFKKAEEGINIYEIEITKAEYDVAEFEYIYTNTVIQVYYEGEISKRTISTIARTYFSYFLDDSEYGYLHAFSCIKI